MSSLDNFNNNLEQLLNTIILNYPDQKQSIEEYYILPLDGNKYLNMFYENCRTKGNFISNKDEIIFSKESIILNNIDFNLIWNDNKIDEKDRHNIWKYLHTLYLYSFEYKKNKDIKTIVEELKNLSSENRNIDEHTQTFLSIIDSLSQEVEKIKKHTNIDTEIDNILNEHEESLKKNTDGIAGNIFGGLKLDNMDQLFNGTIGNIAKEIIDDIDMEKMDIGDPSKLLGNLLSGKIDENNGLMSMVKNITEKIHTKVNESNIKQEDLVGEAENMMSNLKSMTNNPIFSNLFKNMNLGNMNMNIPKNAKPQIDQNKVRLQGTRERLRRKLQKKKEALQKIQNSKKQE